MISMKKILTLVLLMTALSAVHSLNCDKIANSTGVDLEDSTRCMCQQDYYWDENKCISIAEFFQELEVAAYKLDLTEAVKCESHHYAAEGTCFDCDSMVENCIECSGAVGNGSNQVNGTHNVSAAPDVNLSLNNSFVICSKCADFAYISSTTKSCQLCSNAISECFLCSSETVCTECNAGFFLNGSICSAQPTCNVENCDLCDGSDPDVCTDCFGDYELATDGSACAEPTCAQHLYFDGQTCACLDGFYDAGTTCEACIDNCLACTTASDCTLAADTYSISLSSGSSAVTIVTCAEATGDANCLLCPNGVCTLCMNGFIAFGGSCVRFKFGFRGFFLSIFGFRLFCGRGMRSCQSNTMATSCFRGYSLFQGACYKCPKGVQECSYQAGTMTTIATGCSRRWFLKKGTCTKCSDSNCVKCRRANFCKTCIDGYVSVNGVCTACSEGCLSCASADTCLPNRCGSGYGYLLDDGVGRCNRCIQGCGKCDTDITACDKCSDGLYDTALAGATSLDCVPCPTGCSLCTSDTVCSECSFGYTLSGTTCVQSCSFPCTECDSTDPSICTDCFGGYTLNNNTCVQVLDCTACTACPRGYFLTDAQLCIACTVADTNCAACSDTNISECVECNSGYYLDETGACAECSTGCATCEDATVCLVPMTGYYLVSQSSGVIQTCDSNCLTCSNSAQSCLTCGTGYFLQSNYCQTNRRVSYGLKLGGAAYTLILFRLIFFWWFGIFRLRIRRRRKQCGFRRIFFSSVNMEGDISIDPTEDANEVANDVAETVGSSEIGGLAVESSSTSTTGFTQEESSNNLGLILGVSIPVGILIIAVLVAAVVKLKNRDKYTKAEHNDQNLSEEEFPKGDNYL